MLIQRNHNVVPASRFLAQLAASASRGPERAGRLTNREAAAGGYLRCGPHDRPA